MTKPSMNFDQGTPTAYILSIHHLPEGEQSLLSVGGRSLRYQRKEVGPTIRRDPDEQSDACYCVMQSDAD